MNKLKTLTKNDLFCGCFGNGTLFCDRRVHSYGDYKRIAHVDDYGKTTFYVNSNELSDEIKTLIKDTSNDYKTRFIKAIERMPRLQAWERLADKMPLSIWLGNSKKPIDEQITIYTNYLTGDLKQC